MCGSYRDVSGEGRQAKELLLRTQDALIAVGFDAYTQLHPRAQELAPGLRPAAMTRTLERASDLTVYIGVPFGREGGWSAELSDIQRDYPEGATKRAVLVHPDFPLSQVLSNEHEGHLSDPFVPVIEWEKESELVAVISRLAAHLAEHGRLPQATRRRGRLKMAP